MLNVSCPADWRPEEWQRTAQSSTTTAWPGNQWNYITVTKKKNPLSRINSLKWRNNPSMTHLLTPHHRLQMFCNSSSVWMLVWYTDTLPSEQRLSDRCENKIRCKSTLCFFLHSRENSTTQTDPYGITLFFQKYPACHRSLSLVWILELWTSNMPAHA